MMIFHRNDKDADFEALYQKELLPLINFIRKYVSDLDQAKDIASDCFCDLYERWYSSEDKTGFLYLTAKQTAQKSIHRKEVAQNHEKRYIAVVINDGVSSSPFLNNETFTNFINDILTNIGDDLKPYFFHYAAGKSQQQVAELLGVSQKTVSKNLEKAYEFAKHYIKVNGLSKTS